MKHEESLIQQSCIFWFDHQYPKLRLNLFSIPNERKTDLKTNKKGQTYSPSGARMKAQGRRRGVADLFLALGYSDRNYHYHGFFIEMKSAAGRQEKEQKEFQKAVEAKGYKYAIIRNFDEFEKEINEYLK